MNKLCVRLFIIIFMIYTHKSEYIPTINNFASILANCFCFLWKITALWPSVLNFWGWLVKFCHKSAGQTVKNACVSCGLRRILLEILCSVHILSIA